MKRSRQTGFTLLEVLIAFAIITIVAMRVYINQSSALFSSVHTKNLLLAGNLARNFLAKSEQELEIKEFTLLKEEESGSFPEPYEKFKWKREIKEQDFSVLSAILTDATAKDKDREASNDSNDGAETYILKIFQNYLKDSLRKLKVTISWQEDGKDQSVTFNTFLVRYDAQFRPSE